MAYKEAEEIIKTARAEVEWEYPLDYAAAFDKAIEAMEKCQRTEPLTDTEQRIFLAAMSKEEKVCKEVCADGEGVDLVAVCHSIKRKVKKALWE